jgi:hypothetical protein
VAALHACLQARGVRAFFGGALTLLQRDAPSTWMQRALGSGRRWTRLRW